MAQRHPREEFDLLLMTAKQLASGLVRTMADAYGASRTDLQRWRIPQSALHFHDNSTSQIAFNDVQAVMLHNEAMGTTLPVPLMPTEGYNTHGHTSQFDGGWIPGAGPHDHRDNFNGGFAFAIFHPGTRLPQQPWAI